MNANITDDEPHNPNSKLLQSDKWGYRPRMGLRQLKFVNTW